MQKAKRKYVIKRDKRYALFPVAFVVLISISFFLVENVFEAFGFLNFFLVFLVSYDASARRAKAFSFYFFEISYLLFFTVALFVSVSAILFSWTLEAAFTIFYVASFGSIFLVVYFTRNKKYTDRKVEVFTAKRLLLNYALFVFILLSPIAIFSLLSRLPTPEIDHSDLSSKRALAVAICGNFSTYFTLFMVSILAYLALSPISYAIYRNTRIYIEFHYKKNNSA